VPGDAIAAIGPIHAPKASEIFARVLRQKILDGEFAAGEPLPPERTLVEQSTLSRAAVREAIGILKQQGLVVTRPGRNGGSIVTRPTSQDLISSLETYLRSRGEGENDATLLEMREIMEPWGAALAAARRTSSDLERIRQAHEHAVESVDSISAYVSAGQRWHSAVADASHNVLVAAFLRARSESVLSAADRARYDSLSARTATLEAHEALTSAIADQDPQRAFQLMSQHVQAGELALLQTLVDQTRRDAAKESPAPHLDGHARR
jgi:DNA-binding FadR family transcriptional regulator